MKKILTFLSLPLIAMVMGVSCTDDTEDYVQPTEVTVIFDSQGGTAVASQTVPYGSKLEEPADPTNTSALVFDAWYVDETGYTTFDFENDVVYYDTRLYARWLSLYTVTFVYSNGDSDTSSMVSSGTVIDEPSTPTREGYEFVDWYAVGSSLPYDFTSTVTKDVTIVAKWQEESNEATVTFYQNFNGSTASYSTIVFKGDTVDAIDDSLVAPMASCVTSGWYTDATCTTPYDFTTAVTKTLSLYAGEWRLKDASDNTYPVVEVGGVYWMAQNLRTTKYNDGTDIEITNETSRLQEATSSVVPLASYLKSDTELETDASVVERTEKKGLLYNYYAVEVGVCPAGWSIPEVADYSAMFTSASSVASNVATDEVGAWEAGDYFTDAAPQYSPMYDASANNSSGLNFYPNPFMDWGNLKSGYWVSPYNDVVGPDCKEQTNVWSSSDGGSSGTQKIGIIFTSQLITMNIYFGRDQHAGLTVRCIQD